MREDYQAVLDRAGIGKKIVGFPAAPAIWALRVLEALQRVAALQVGLRDGVEGLVRVDREGRAAARLHAEVLEQGRAAAQLRVVHARTGTQFAEPSGRHRTACRGSRARSAW